MVPKLYLNYIKASIKMFMPFFNKFVFRLLFGALRAGNMLSNKMKTYVICILAANKQSEL